MTENTDRTETEDGYVTVEYSKEEKQELYAVDGAVAGDRSLVAWVAELVAGSGGTNAIDEDKESR